MTGWPFSAYPKSHCPTKGTTHLAAPASQPEGQVKQADKETWVSARQRVRADARLYPESWILKIRSRLRRGDVIGARASLKLFVERYPQETVPSNLKPLLDE